MSRRVAARSEKSAKPLIEKPRLDALTDGLFGVAMTLLVIDLKLPENFRPTSAADLLTAFWELHTQFLVYAISFFVLGIRWTSLARAPGEKQVGDAYVRWALAHLFLITFIPFSTMVVARYGGFAPAIWLYALNTALAALVALQMTALSPNDPTTEARRRGLFLLLASSALVVVVSFYAPRYALLAYLLNAAAPAFGRKPSR